MTAAGGASDRELLRRYHEEGDLEARQQLIEQYLPLVRSLARRYANRGEQLEDLVQVGSIGLIKAIDRFDVDRGVELTTYATPNIIGEIKRHFRDKGWSIRVPRGPPGAQRPPLAAPRAADRRARALADDPRAGRGRRRHGGGGARGARVGPGVLDASRSRRRPARARTASSTRSRRWASSSTSTRSARTAPSWRPGLDVLDERERRILHLRFWEGLTQSQIAARSASRRCTSRA